MSWFTAFIGFLAPLFIALSPVLSYGDQALAMHRAKSSSGFSLDIPLIMLVASFLRYGYLCVCVCAPCSPPPPPPSPRRRIASSAPLQLEC